MRNIQHTASKKSLLRRAGRPRRGRNVSIVACSAAGLSRSIRVCSVRPSTRHTRTTPTTLTFRYERWTTANKQYHLRPRRPPAISSTDSSHATPPFNASSLDESAFSGSFYLKENIHVFCVCRYSISEFAPARERLSRGESTCFSSLAPVTNAHAPRRNGSGQENGVIGVAISARSWTV